MVMKITSLVFGTEKQKQQVIIDFEYRPFQKWFGDDSTIFVNFCHVMDALNFRPTDLEGDLSIAIAEALGEHPKDIKFECNVKHSVRPVMILHIPSYETEMLFI
jgi:hypothetical protein